MKMEFDIFLEDFRGPRKAVFHLKIMRSKSTGNHSALQAKSTNFQGLVFYMCFSPLFSAVFLNNAIHYRKRMEILLYSVSFCPLK